MEAATVFQVLEGTVAILAFLAAVIWIRQRRMRGLYDACKVGRRAAPCSPS
jgi:hypothetical protein